MSRASPFTEGQRSFESGGASKCPSVNSFCLYLDDETSRYQNASLFAVCSAFSEHPYKDLRRSGLYYTGTVYHFKRTAIQHTICTGLPNKKKHLKQPYYSRTKRCYFAWNTIRLLLINGQRFNVLRCFGDHDTVMFCMGVAWHQPRGWEKWCPAVGRLCI